MKKLRFYLAFDKDDKLVFKPTPHGKKVMAKRRAAGKVARLARAANYRAAAQKRRQRQKRRRQSR